jgi:hypothetical protein
MKTKSHVGFTLAGIAVGVLSGGLIALAEERRPERGPVAPFQAHPAGVHPRGPTVRSHPVRVLAPRAVEHGRTTWAHWQHPDFQRPSYYWDWQHVHTVTCTAEDSYGDQYPVSEAAAPGFVAENMTGVEDDALDRCYSESGNDTTCVLLSCTHI